MWDALFTFAPPVLQAVSVAVTAVFAILGLRAWRRQLLGRRKIEIAEGTLFAAYKIKEAMSYIRGPGLVGGSTRPRQPDEPEGLASRRGSYFVPLERMQKASGDFAEFEKMKLLCQVLLRPRGRRAVRARKHSAAHRLGRRDDADPNGRRARHGAEARAKMVQSDLGPRRGRVNRDGESGGREHRGYVPAASEIVADAEADFLPARAPRVRELRG